ncbi:MAG: hypothetical protein P4L33_00255 [Capsulimonadaceae bacterium]|nr:hypothetical protein [Capsulimonadaceae bacterium]
MQRTLLRAAAAGLVLSAIVIFVAVNVREALLRATDRALNDRAAQIIDRITAGIDETRAKNQALPLTVTQIAVRATRAFEPDLAAPTGEEFYLELRTPASRFPLAASTNVPEGSAIGKTLDLASYDAKANKVGRSFAGAEYGTKLRVRTTPMPGTNMIVIVATSWKHNASVIAYICLASAVVVILGVGVTVLCAWLPTDRKVRAGEGCGSNDGEP